MNLKKLPKKLVLQGGTILDPLSGSSKKGNVVIERNKIKLVGSAGGAKGGTMIDCSGLVITHGFCDVHVHFREPGREDKETLQTCLLYTSPSPRDATLSRMPSSA